MKERRQLEVEEVRLGKRRAKEGGGTDAEGKDERPRYRCQGE